MTVTGCGMQRDAVLCAVLIEEGKNKNKKSYFTAPLQYFGTMSVSVSLHSVCLCLFPLTKSGNKHNLLRLDNRVF